MKTISSQSVEGQKVNLNWAQLSKSKLCVEFAADELKALKKIKEILPKIVQIEDAGGVVHRFDSECLLACQKELAFKGELLAKLSGNCA